MSGLAHALDPSFSKPVDDTLSLSPITYQHLWAYRIFIKHIVKERINEPPQRLTSILNNNPDLNGAN